MDEQTDELNPKQKLILGWLVDLLYGKDTPKRGRSFGFICHAQSRLFKRYCNWIQDRNNFKDKYFKRTAASIFEAIAGRILPVDGHDPVVPPYFHQVVLVGEGEEMIEILKKSFDNQTIFYKAMNASRSCKMDVPLSLDKTYGKFQSLAVALPQIFRYGFPKWMNFVYPDVDEVFGWTYLNDMINFITTNVTRGKEIAICGNSADYLGNALYGLGFRFTGVQIHKDYNTIKDNPRVELAIIVHPEMAEDPSLILRNKFKNMKYYLVLADEETEGSYSLWGTRWSGEEDPKAKVFKDGFMKKTMPFRGQMRLKKPCSTVLFHRSNVRFYQKF